MAEHDEIRTFEIRITSANPDAEDIVRKAAERIAMEIDPLTDPHLVVEAVESGGVATVLDRWAAGQTVREG